MAISPATVKRHWTVARAWLARELEGEPRRREPLALARDHDALSHTRSATIPASRERQLAESGPADPDLAARGPLSAAQPRQSAALSTRRSGRQPARSCRKRCRTSRPRLGRRIGRYRVVEEIGRGGMGVVYAARGRAARPDGRVQVAAGGASRTIAHRRARLTREARAAAALSHPAIATIFSLEETDDGSTSSASWYEAGRCARSWRRARCHPARVLTPRSSMWPPRSMRRTPSASSTAI